jgi:glucose/arabinose dehydrogenase/plastocyanin
VSRLRVLTFGVLALLLLAPLWLHTGGSLAQDATPGAEPGASGPAHLGGDLPGDPQIQLIEVASGLDTPVHIAFPPDGSGRIFVAEVTGRIRIINPDGSIEPQPFLDLSNTVALRPGQQGLLGLAFHPDYAKNGRFFVDYNNLYANGQLTISEFTVDPTDPNLADVKSERPLLTIAKPYPQHNGGTLQFGSDGTLYISTGDGGWQGDPFDNAQSRFSLLGKILRIDVDSNAAGQPYGIPADNPFAGTGRYDNPYPGDPPPPANGEKQKKTRNKDNPSGVSAENRKNRSPVRPEIWAIGFRNPWQFSFDPKTGDFYVGDVGADTWEEIDFQEAGTTAGQNYGWDWLEAAHCYPEQITECPRQQVGLLPIAEYQHGDDGCAVIGIGVSRNEAYPSLDGIYFSGEFCTGEIRGLQRDEHGVWQFQNLLDSSLQITGSGQDADGTLYVGAITSQRPTEAGEAGPGSIWKIVPADQVPAGATTIPLGQPGVGNLQVDENGEPIGMDLGDDEAEEPAAAPAATPIPASTSASAEAAQEVVIGLYDIYFDPDRITIPADTDVRLVFENRGASPHNFTLKEHDISVDVAPGESGEVVLNLPRGSYKFICDVPGHKQVGMNGSIVVK